MSRARVEMKKRKKMYPKGSRHVASRALVMLILLLLLLILDIATVVVGSRSPRIFVSIATKLMEKSIKKDLKKKHTEDSRHVLTRLELGHR